MEEYTTLRIDRVAEKRLACAVMSLALTENDKTWLKSNEDSLFSFSSCCSMIGIDKELLLQILSDKIKKSFFIKSLKQMMRDSAI